MILDTNILDMLLLSFPKVTLVKLQVKTIWYLHNRGRALWKFHVLTLVQEYDYKVHRLLVS